MILALFDEKRQNFTVVNKKIKKNMNETKMMFKKKMKQVVSTNASRGE